MRQETFTLSQKETATSGCDFPMCGGEPGVCNGKKALVRRGGPEAIGSTNEKEAGAEGSGFRSAGLPLGLGSSHGLAGDRRATSVISVFVSLRASCGISFSRGDIGSCLPRMDPDVQTCERK